MGPPPRGGGVVGESEARQPLPPGLRAAPVVLPAAEVPHDPRLLPRALHDAPAPRPPPERRHQHLLQRRVPHNRDEQLRGDQVDGLQEVRGEEPLPDHHQRHRRALLPADRHHLRPRAPQHIDAARHVQRVRRPLSGARGVPGRQSLRLSEIASRKTPASTCTRASPPTRSNPHVSSPRGTDPSTECGARRCRPCGWRERERERERQKQMMDSASERSGQALPPEEAAKGAAPKRFARLRLRTSRSGCCSWWSSSSGRTGSSSA